MPSITEILLMLFYLAIFALFFGVVIYIGMHVHVK